MTRNELDKAVDIVMYIAKTYNRNDTSYIARIETKFGLQQFNNLYHYQGILVKYFIVISPTWSGPYEINFRREFSIEQLAQIYRGTFLLEVLFFGGVMGSVSAVDKIYSVLAKRNHDVAMKMRKWDNNYYKCIDLENTINK